MVPELKLMESYPKLSKLYKVLDLDTDRKLILNFLSIKTSDNQIKFQPICFFNRTEYEFEKGFEKAFIRAIKIGTGYYFKDDTAFGKNSYTYVSPEATLVDALYFYCFNVNKLTAYQQDLLKENPYLSLLMIRPNLHELQTLQPIIPQISYPSRIPVHLFRMELLNALSCDFPSEWFRNCDKLGILDHFMPELTANKGCGQDPRYHEEDVFDHSLRAVDEARNFTSDPLLKLAILMHDCGKAFTRKEELIVE